MIPWSTLTGMSAVRYAVLKLLAEFLHLRRRRSSLGPSESRTRRRRLRQINPNVAIVLFAGITAGVNPIHFQFLISSQRRNQLALTSVGVKLPSVIAALDLFAIEPSARQRHAAMRTSIVHGERRAPANRALRPAACPTRGPAVIRWAQLFLRAMARYQKPYSHCESGACFSGKFHRAHEIWSAYIISANVYARVRMQKHWAILASIFLRAVLCRSETAGGGAQHCIDVFHCGSRSRHRTDGNRRSLTLFLGRISRSLGRSGSWSRRDASRRQRRLRPESFNVAASGTHRPASRRQTTRRRHLPRKRRTPVRHC